MVIPEPPDVRAGSSLEPERLVRDEILSGLDKGHPDVLRVLAGRRSESARASAQDAFGLAKRHERVEYAFALLAAATAAGATVLVKHEGADLTLWTVAALVASAGASLRTFLNTRRVKNHHWSRRAVLGALAQSYEVVALAPEAPSKEEMAALSEEWQKAHAGIAE